MIGRAGRSGKAITFFTAGNRSNAKDLIDLLSQAHQPVPDELVAISQLKVPGRNRGKKKKAEANVSNGATFAIRHRLGSGSGSGGNGSTAVDRQFTGKKVVYF